MQREMTRQQVCKEFGVCESTIARMIKRGEIPARKQKVSGNISQYLIPAKEVNKLKNQIKGKITTTEILHKYGASYTTIATLSRRNLIKPFKLLNNNYYDPDEVDEAISKLKPYKNYRQRKDSNVEASPLMTTDSNSTNLKITFEGPIEEIKKAFELIHKNQF